MWTHVGEEHEVENRAAVALRVDEVLAHLQARASKWIERRIVVAAVLARLAPADPAPVLLALAACHVVAAVALLRGDAALRAWLAALVDEPERLALRPALRLLVRLARHARVGVGVVVRASAGAQIGSAVVCQRCQAS